MNEHTTAGRTYVRTTILHELARGGLQTYLSTILNL